MGESTFFNSLTELVESLAKDQPITQMSKKEIMRQRGTLQEIVKVSKELRKELIEEKNRRYARKASE